jgi:hypothetical protein
VVEDSIDKHKLITLSPEELGNDAVMEQAEKVARDFVKQAFKPSTIPEPKEELQSVQTNPTVKVTTDTPKSETSVDPLLNKVQTPIAASPVNQPSLESLISKLDTTPVTSIPTDVREQQDEPEPDRDFVWTGNIKMPQEAAFNGSANQVCGPKVPNPAWIDIVPTNLTISGRINQTTASKYIYERLDQKSDIVVLEIIPDEKTKSGFEKLTKYLSTKQRFGVITVKTQALKDIYLCPVLRSQPILPIITDLKPSFPLQTIANHDRFFATIIFSTGYLNKLNQKYLKPPSRPKPVEPAPTPVSAPIDVPVNVVPPPSAKREIPPPPKLLEAVGLHQNQVGSLIRDLINSGLLNK